MNASHTTFTFSTIAVKVNVVFLFRLSVREEVVRRAFLSRGGRNLFFRLHFENALLPYKRKRRGEDNDGGVHCSMRRDWTAERG